MPSKRKRLPPAPRGQKVRKVIALRRFNRIEPHKTRPAAGGSARDAQKSVERELREVQTRCGPGGERLWYHPGVPRWIGRATTWLCVSCLGCQVNEGGTTGGGQPFEVE